MSIETMQICNQVELPNALHVAKMMEAPLKTSNGISL
jgi:hypothetical protein